VSTGISSTPVAAAPLAQSLVGGHHASLTLLQTQAVLKYGKTIFDLWHHLGGLNFDIFSSLSMSSLHQPFVLTCQRLRCTGLSSEHHNQKGEIVFQGEPSPRD